jgi:WD40 repeat protein
VAFTADGKMLASAGDDGTVRLWNTSDPTAPSPLGSPLTGHDGPVLAVAFTGDGKMLASAGGDGTVRLWNTSDPAAPSPLGSPLTGHDNWAHAVAFTADGRMLASAGDDGTVRQWNLTLLIGLRDDAMERACSITRGGPSRDEWGNHVPDVEYVDVCKG